MEFYEKSYLDLAHADFAKLSPLVPIKRYFPKQRLRLRGSYLCSNRIEPVGQESPSPRVPEIWSCVCLRLFVCPWVFSRCQGYLKFGVVCVCDFWCIPGCSSEVYPWPPRCHRVPRVLHASGCCGSHRK